MRFRTISLPWKKVADNSSVWLRIELNFTAPVDFYRISNVSRKLLQEHFSLHVELKELEEDYGFSCLSEKGRSYSIRIIPYSNFLDTSTIVITDKIRIEKTRNAFLFHLKAFNQSWLEYILYFQQEQRIKEFFSPITDRLPSITIFDMVLLTLTLYPFLEDINLQSGWSISQNIGFFVWYVHILCAFAIFILLGVLEIYWRITTFDIRDLKPYASLPWHYGIPCFVPACLFLGTGLSILLFQMKFTYFASPHLTWAMTTYPICIFYVLSFIAIYYYEHPSYPSDKNFFLKLFIRVSLILFLPLFFLLLGIYCDNYNTSNSMRLTRLQVLLALFPACLFSFILSYNSLREIFRISKYLEFWQRFEMFATLLPKVVSTISITLLLLIIVVRFLQDTLTLERGIRIFLFICICSHICFYFEQFKY